MEVYPYRRLRRRPSNDGLIGGDEEDVVVGIVLDNEQRIRRHSQKCLHLRGQDHAISAGGVGLAGPKAEAAAAAAAEAVGREGARVQQTAGVSGGLERCLRLRDVT